MRIYPVSNNYKTYTPHFRANNIWAYGPNGEKLYKKTTNYFRDDLDWAIFTDYICAKYKNCSKVNVIIHACSNGMEAYSFVIKMLSSHMDSAIKFFPVIAKDIDKENIEIAKNNFSGASDGDLLRILENTGRNASDFLITKKSASIPNQTIIYPKDFVKNKIIFEQGDIFEDIDKMPNTNTILFCRNFWQYLEPEKQELLAKKISEHFIDDSSLVVIGDYDASGMCEDLLCKYGMMEVPFVKNVFKKKNPARPLYLY